MAVAAIYLRGRISFDISLSVQKIFRRTLSTPKKSVEHGLRFKRAALRAF
jgi:hypothetical protein